MAPCGKTSPPVLLWPSSLQPPTTRRDWLRQAAVCASAACAAASSADPQVQRQQAPAAQEWLRLAAEYRELQAGRGHFDEGGRWQAALDAHGGRKQQLMEGLRQALLALPDAERPDRVRLLQALGEPEMQWLGAERALAPLPAGWQPAAADRLLWYRWRGRRDGLLLWLRGESLYRIDWSLSWE